MYVKKFAKERLEVRMSVSNLLARGEFPNGSASASRERDAFGPYPDSARFSTYFGANIFSWIFIFEFKSCSINFKFVFVTAFYYRFYCVPVYMIFLCYFLSLFNSVKFCFLRTVNKHGYDVASKSVVVIKKMHLKVKFK